MEAKPDGVNLLSKDMIEYTMQALFVIYIYIYILYVHKITYNANIYIYACNIYVSFIL